MSDEETSPLLLILGNRGSSQKRGTSQISWNLKKKPLRILKHFLILNWTTGSRALGIALQLGLQILLQVKGAEEKAFDTLNAHSA